MSHLSMWASAGVPSWLTIPSRSVTVAVVKSEETSHDTAASPSNPPLRGLNRSWS